MAAIKKSKNEPLSEMRICTIPIKDIIIDTHHKRRQSAKAFDAACAELAARMQEEGQLVPAKVADAEGGGFRLVFGLRRLTACIMNGDDTIRAVLGGPMSDDEIEAERLSENLNREDASPIDEMVGLGKIYDALEASLPECDGEALSDDDMHTVVVQLVADKIGKTARWVRDRLYLQRLCEKVVEMVTDGRLPLAHARQIAKLGSDKEQAELARAACLENDGTGGMQVETLAHLVSRRLTKLDGVVWRLEVPFARRPACERCGDNTGTDSLLFEGGERPEKAHCLNVVCFNAKSRAAHSAIDRAVKKIGTRLEGQKIPDIKLGTLRESGLIPEPIKPATMAARARAKLAPKPAMSNGVASQADSPETGPGANDRSEALRQIDLEVEAEAAWCKHQGARWKSEEEAVAAAVKESHQRLWMLFAISIADTGGGHQTPKAKKARAALLERSLRLFAMPPEELTLEDLRGLARMLLAVYAGMDRPLIGIYASTEEAIDKAGEMLLGPQPDEAAWKRDWVAEHQPKPKTPTTPPPTTTTTPVAKKTGKKATKKAAAKKVAKKKTARKRAGKKTGRGARA